MAQEQTSTQQTRWWKSGFAWLVVGGPAAVVIASLITVYIAVNGQDPVLSHEENDPKPKAANIEEKNSLEPAMRARNHAATGVNQE